MFARTSRRRIALVAIALGCAACSTSSSSSGGTGGSSASSSSTAITTDTSVSSSAADAIQVTVSGGTVRGGVQRKKVSLGATVVLRVSSDIADEVHVHGYDKKADVAAGGSVEVAFTADIPGVFEAELEQAHLTLIELEIS